MGIGEHFGPYRDSKPYSLGISARSHNSNNISNNELLHCWKFWSGCKGSVRAVPFSADSPSCIVPRGTQFENYRVGASISAMSSEVCSGPNGCHTTVTLDSEQVTASVFMMNSMAEIIQILWAQENRLQKTMISLACTVSNVTVPPDGHAPINNRIEHQGNSQSIKRPIKNYEVSRMKQRNELRKLGNSQTPLPIPLHNNDSHSSNRNS
jgi:hypothetical protein